KKVYRKTLSLVSLRKWVSTIEKRGDWCLATKNITAGDYYGDYAWSHHCRGRILNPNVHLAKRKEHPFYGCSFSVN
ncbi:MAG: hypothetical protein WCX20_02360, partial [Candidatus Shapirobacteria bacterium]